jgi:succinate dehydrogenase / fumarate reductase cytochrome b subunit
VSNLRPKNLNLFTIQFPIPAIASILHRLSGFILFLMIPLALWLLSFSLTAAGFEELTSLSALFYMKLLFWLLLMPFCYHLVAGVRHLLADIHIGDSLRGGRLGAQLTIFISIILIILMGIWLW